MSLDKVRPGGVVAFVTSSGTMDKQNSAVRKYIAERAELLGAIRLPNNAFLANAGTGVVADILFLQKRDRPIEVDADWIHLGITEDGHTINQYFVDNPDMVLGELTVHSTGNRTSRSSRMRTRRFPSCYPRRSRISTVISRKSNVKKMQSRMTIRR